MVVRRRFPWRPAGSARGHASRRRTIAPRPPLRRGLRGLAPISLILGLVLANAACTAPNPDPAAAPGGHYELDPAHASVTARVLHMGLSRYTLRFDKLAASYDYDPAQPEATRVTATIEARSLDTGDKADSARFSDLFLDADAHPIIRFVSTGMTRSDPDHGKLDGLLTLAGVTRPISLDVTYNGTEAEIVGGRRMGFSARATIRRSDFGAAPLRAFVGNEVDLDLELEFVRRGDAAPAPAPVDGS